MLENYLWGVSKPDIQIFFPNRFVEGRGEGAGWVFVISMGMEEGGWRKGYGGVWMEDICRRKGGV